MITSSCHRSRERALVVWLCGFSGAGKSTLALRVCSELLDRGHSAYVLDGDLVRSGLCQDLGFSEKDRTENIRRSAEVARMLCDCGHIVLAAFISPRKHQRQMAAGIVGSHRFSEVFIQCPIGICEQRDPKGIYKKFRTGAIHSLTGKDAPFETPDRPHLVIRTSEMSVSESVEMLLGHIIQKLQNPLHLQRQESPNHSLET